ncbi:MAG: hypothetical protein HC942_04010, partial [Microcoleus sp. SU_5_6]|nr:hypothetical protein [Microcoleus sp. SU_5_6]
QKAEGRRQRAEGRRQRAEGRRKRAEGRRKREEPTDSRLSRDWDLTFIRWIYFLAAI